MWSAFTVVVLRIVSCVRSCLAFGFVSSASRAFIKLHCEVSEHYAFVVREASVIGNLGGQNLNEFDEMNEVHWLKEISNASTRG